MRARTTLVLVGFLGIGGFAACGGSIVDAAPDEDGGASMAPDASQAEASAAPLDAAPSPDAPSGDAMSEPHGVLDPSFGVGGFATATIGGADQDTVHCMRANGGRLLIATEASPEGTGPGPAWATAFAMDGKLDTTFSAPTGKDFLSNVLVACAVDANGRLVASVRDFTSEGFLDRIERWAVDGGADSAFSRIFGLANAIAVDPAGGYVVEGGPGADGTTVTWFGVDGSITASTNVPLTGAQYAAVSSVVLPSGALLVSVDGALLAIRKTGLDASFGTGGRVPVVGKGMLALAANGEIVLVHSVGGAYATASPDVFVERFTMAGTRVSAVHVGALREYVVLDGAIIVQPNGKAVVAGRNWTSTAVFRLLPNGSLDPGFGVGGVLALPLRAERRVLIASVTDTSFAVVGDHVGGIGVALVR